MKSQALDLLDKDFNSSKCIQRAKVNRRERPKNNLGKCCIK